MESAALSSTPGWWAGLSPAPGLGEGVSLLSHADLVQLPALRGHCRCVWANNASERGASPRRLQIRRERAPDPEPGNRNPSAGPPSALCGSTSKEVSGRVFSQRAELIPSLLDSLGPAPQAQRSGPGQARIATVSSPGPYRRTPPQYRQSTRKMQRRARVTRTWDVCRTSTTMASMNCTTSTEVWGWTGTELHQLLPQPPPAHHEQRAGKILPTLASRGPSLLSSSLSAPPPSPPTSSSPWTQALWLLAQMYGPGGNEALLPAAHRPLCLATSGHPLPSALPIPTGKAPDVCRAS